MNESKNNNVVDVCNILIKMLEHKNKEVGNEKVCLSKHKNREVGLRYHPYLSITQTQ